MGLLSNQLKLGVISDAIQSANNNINTVAKVTGTDQANNTCSIEYIDKGGRKATIKKAFVDMRNNDWFPEDEEIVVVRIVNNKSAVIEQKYTEDYAKDVRSKSSFKNDIMADDDGTCCGSVF